MGECPVCGGEVVYTVEANVHKTFSETGELDEGTSDQVAYDECADCGHKEMIEDV